MSPFVPAQISAVWAMWSRVVALSFFQKLLFAKNVATNFRRVSLNHAGSGFREGDFPETKYQANQD
jgi:hypothetical protein